MKKLLLIIIILFNLKATLTTLIANPNRLFTCQESVNILENILDESSKKISLEEKNSLKHKLEFPFSLQARIEGFHVYRVIANLLNKHDIKDSACLCAVCQNKMELDSKTLSSPYQCLHVYHDQCISRWLNSRSDLQTFCPSCRELERESVSISVSSCSDEKIKKIAKSIRKNNIDDFKKQLEEVDSTQSTDGCLLVNAVHYSRQDMLEYLLEKGFNVRGNIFSLKNPLIVAAKENKKDILNLLLERSENNQIVLNNALSLASQNGNDKIVDILISKGSDLRDDIYTTSPALVAAAKFGHLDIVKRIVEIRGCDIDIKNGFGNSALAMSARNGYEDITDYLIRNGSNINSQNLAGNTPIIFAVMGGHYKVFKKLLEAKADYSMKNSINQSAIDIARKKGFRNITELIYSELV